jgi:hypothetical protein
MPSCFELDPREADAFVCGMPLRQELVYRLAIRRACARCRGDRRFKKRTHELLFEFRKDLRAVLKEAAKLEAKLVAAVAGRQPRRRRPLARGK